MGADETAVNGGMQIPDMTRSRMLEHKYIELLEKRIAALEALTADNTTNHVSWLIQDWSYSIEACRMIHRYYY
jgi:hypothetical protein